MYGGLGILASWNFRYTVVKPKTLAAMVRTHWKDHEVDARSFVAATQVATIDSLRKTNNRKALLVSCALVTQLAALVALGVVVFLVIMRA
jgi:hypothetical protein